VNVINRQRARAKARAASIFFTAGLLVAACAPITSPDSSPQADGSSEIASLSSDPEVTDEVSPDAEEALDPNRDVASLQEKLFQELKEAQQPYSARQNRMTCAFMFTNPEKLRELHTTEYELSWEEFVDPFVASCWEWIEGMSEQDMQALVIFENEVMPDIYPICDKHREFGRKLTRTAMKDWLEMSAEPASLAGPITDLIASECKKR